MALNPSNYVAERNNPGKTMFPNLARRDGCPQKDVEIVNNQVISELSQAGIEVSGPYPVTRNSEVPYRYLGDLCGWSFKRAWYYWIANGPDVPADKAEEFHKTWGKQVRVDGHCGCPSPLEWFHGFAVGHYHIDTQEGLNAFADLLRSIYKD